MGKEHVHFNVCLGNPPYQASGDEDSEQKNFAPPVYNLFLDEGFKIADIVEMIHPARFLFDAGRTPKAWNEKMLSDTHFKVLDYEANSRDVFPNAEIKGGVAITLHDNNRNFEPIGVFTPYQELNSIFHKAAPKTEEESLMSVIYLQNKFDLDSLYADYPKFSSVIGSNGKDKRFRNNIFDKIDIFTDSRVCPDDLKVLGVVKNKRMWKFFPKKYTDLNHENLDKWKVFVPRVNGSGAFEVFSSPVIAEPQQGYTQTFISIGAFETEEEAKNALSYLKTKFCRAMLGILKITQDNNRETWRTVPNQNFGMNSDIDWSLPIREIDKQLYQKYGLNKSEIDFIESHVKEMN